MCKIFAQIAAIMLLTAGQPQHISAQADDARQQHLDAINAYFGSGVTPDENGVVLVHSAFGPHPENATLPAGYYDRLGIPSPPETGDYFDNYVCSSGELMAFNEQLEKAMESPWTRDQHPLILAWLESEEKPVEVMIEAVHRPKWFTPLDPGYDEDGQRQPLYMTLLPATQQYRSVARYLICRAMLRTGEQDFEGAWKDIYHCQRLSRMVARGSTLIDFLVGLAINNIATEATVTFIEHADPNAAALGRFRRDLASLPDMPDPAAALDFTERLMIQDAIDMLEDHDYRILEGTQYEDPPTLLRLALLPVNWDLVRHQTQDMYTTIVHASRLADLQQRSETLLNIDARLARRRELSTDNVLQRVMEQPTLTAAFSSLVADQLSGLFLPAVNAVDSARNRSNVRRQLGELLLAVEQFRQRTGRYPESLSQLAAAEPELTVIDPFAAAPLTYEVRDNGFTIYSIGVNRKDDGGKTYGEELNADDLRVSVAREAG